VSALLECDSDDFWPGNFISRRSTTNGPERLSNPATHSILPAELSRRRPLGISRTLRRSTEEIFLASPSPFSRLCRGLIFYSSVVQFGNCSAPVGAFERPELRLCKGLERTPSTLPTLVEIAPNCIEISHFPILAFREEPSCLLRRELVTRLRLR
jgi:hypothetical protein